MNNKNIEWIQNYLDGQNPPLDKLIEGTTNRDKFKLRTVIRLKKAYDFYKNRNGTLNDFLIAFRDFLIVFDINLRLKNIEIPESNGFGIYKNRSGEYYAKLELPKGINHEFVNQVFMRDWSEKKKENYYDLITDPFIFKITGYTSFKSLSQKIAVYGALKTPPGYTTLIALQTGGGKSLITQLMGYRDNGLTIVVVPTVSLSLDQKISAKKSIKISKEEEIFSYTSGDNPQPILDAIQNQTARLLFISPEALLNNQNFKAIIDHANETRYLKNIIIDEAHLVVDWGADFRVDYQCLEAWRKDLLFQNPQIRTFLLSATFEERSVQILKNAFSEQNKWIEIRCDALRHEPRFILKKEKSCDKKKKMALELIKKLPHPMIVYLARPFETDILKGMLKEQGITNVYTYTGKTKRTDRERVLKAWKEDEFEIILATSAFGVGVDKPDVRTVLHLNIPENPNAYYQELGRGGRDQLPSLSVICSGPDDLNVTYQRINKRVMTPEKIIARWDSMYNNQQSVRENNLIHIDTAIKPNYRETDEWEDSISDADVRWNIYVLLLFRRYALIDIKTITKSSNSYIMTIEILDDRLRRINEKLHSLIDGIRQEEWDWYESAYNEMKNGVRDTEECISEMFLNTYKYVDEYCAGCPAHDYIIDYERNHFPLKKKIKITNQEISAWQRAFFNGKSEMIIEYADEDLVDLIDSLIEKDLSCIVESENILNRISFLERSNRETAVFIMGKRELNHLRKQGNYFISGVIAVLYPDNKEEAIRLFENVKRLGNRNDARIIHILKHDIKVNADGKRLSDLITGPKLRSDNI